MRKAYLLFAVLPAIFLAQRKKPLVKTIEPSIEAKANYVLAFGNNYLSKDLRPFFGYGFETTFIANKKYGLGLDFNWLYSNAIYGKENLVGNLNAPTMVNVDFYLMHQDELSEVFFLQEIAGISTYRMKSKYVDNSETFKEGDIGFHIGLRGLYNLDSEGHQKFVVGVIGKYYTNNIFNENIYVKKYYDKSYLVHLSIGYRYGF